MDEQKLRQLFKNRADAYLNTIDESVEQGMSEDCFIETIKEALSQHDVMRSAFKEAYDKWHETKDDGELGNWLFAKSKGITT